MDPMIRKNTRNGAMHFSPFTKSVPRSEIPSRPGITKARTIPIRSPATMRMMRLMDVHLSQSSLSFM